MPPELPQPDHEPRRRLFNTPLECGFRLLFILNAARPHSADLQRLVSYDYLLVHSGDVDGGPESLHPAVPFRGTEWVVKRQLIDAGLNVVVARDLVARIHGPSGIVYAGTDLTTAFVTLLRSSYASLLRERAAWLAARFHAFNDDDLQAFMTKRVGRWGAEFDNLSALGELEL